MKLYMSCIGQLEIDQYMTVLSALCSNWFVMLFSGTVYQAEASGPSTIIR